MTTVKRITSYHRTVTVDGRDFTAEVWVGLGHLPADHDPDDFTLPEVTHRYFTARALKAAMLDGTAFLPTTTTSKENQP